MAASAPPRTKSGSASTIGVASGASKDSNARTGSSSASTGASGAVSSIAEGLEKLSTGDLVFRLRTPFAADYEKLREDFNRAVESLDQAIGEIKRRRDVLLGIANGLLGQIARA